MSSAPPPRSLRLAKLRAVVAAREVPPKQPPAPKPPAAAPEIRIPIEVLPRAPLSRPPVSVRAAMGWSIAAWTAIMPLWLGFVTWLRQGEGALPNLPLGALLQTHQVSALIYETAAIWVLGLLYMLPTIVAAARRHPFFIWILLLDVLGSWLVLPWFLALGAALWNPGRHFHAALARWLAPERP